MFWCDECSNDFKELLPCILIQKVDFNVATPDSCPYFKNHEKYHNCIYSKWKKVNIFDKRTKNGLKKGKIYERLYKIFYKNLE